MKKSKKQPAKKTATVKKTTKPAKKATTAKKVTKKTTKKVVKKATLKKSAVVSKKTVKTPIKTTSQYDVVLNHLVKHGSINTMEAIKSYNVLRLGAVIFSLRQGGMNIETGVHTFKNKNGRKTKVAKYVLQA
ncbi:MAG TPA: helix-turn-helix domain-containing protein [Candidatus Paceibacterota bacterium]|nr:helix-turn-helix domain-containing protein [Candidatus Paceibacterota bacterium]